MPAINQLSTCNMDQVILSEELPNLNESTDGVLAMPNLLNGYDIKKEVEEIQFDLHHSIEIKEETSDVQLQPYIESEVQVNWTRNLIKVLIEQYEMQPCLYNTKHKFYTNKHARNRAMLKITEEIKSIDDRIELANIKKKITNIRTQFSHENNKVQLSQKSAVETDDIYVPSIWWYEKLLFLVPHVKTRKTKRFLDLLTPSSEFKNEVKEEFEVEHCNGEIPETTQPCAKKRKYNESSDTITEKTLAVLKVLETKLNIPSTSSIEKSDMQIYAEYLASELRDIGDEELLMDAKHSINNVLYETQKKWLKIKKENQQQKDQLLIFPSDTYKDVKSIYL